MGVQKGKGLPLLYSGICILVLWGLARGNPSAYSAPPVLGFEELLRLAETPAPNGELGLRLRRLLQTPFVSNEAWNSGARPHRPVRPGKGPVLRAVQWNIAGGRQLDLIKRVFTEPASFEAQLARAEKSGVEAVPAIREQLRLLQEADVVILNEADFGMGRTGYRDVARELARALNMNYVFGVEFVEVDKLDLGLTLREVDGPLKAELANQLEVDPARYKGLHGSAILSRYPIRSARIHRLVACYDWYGTERKEIAELEKGRRLAAREVFLERIVRELRHGNRIALIAEIAVPESPTGLLTVVAAQLEGRSPPKCRRAQMADLLLTLTNVANPVILGGDLNTTGLSAAPTSAWLEINKRLSNPDFWIRQAVFRFAIPTVIAEALLLPTNYVKNLHDPTVRDIPLFASNPESGLFRALERFRFRDGYAFDFRGEKTLANSNERALKGFKPTFEFARDYGGLIGTYKLDWFLVKAFLRRPRERKGSRHFAPVYSRTLSELNRSIAKQRISDHDPIAVDLQLTPDRGLPTPSRRSE